MPKAAYYIKPETEDGGWSEDDGKVLLGPDGFGCRLGEPEDCTWYRDGSGAVDRLNEQHDTIEKLKQEIEDLKDDLAYHASGARGSLG